MKGNLKLDIKQLEYFIEIVKCHYNLSRAAERLHVSQPALSQTIRQFEEQEQVELFVRYKGRLQNLTPAGERFYINSQNIIQYYYQMLDELRDNATQYKGKIRIGIPPLVLSVVFSKLLPKLIVENPDVEFEVIEAGAYDLTRMLTLKELDFAVLLQPVYIDSEIIEEYILQQDELTAFMSNKHPYSHQRYLYWNQLEDQSLAIFNSTFMIHHKLKEKFQEEGIHPHLAILSSSWDYLLLSVKNSNFLTILPSPIRNLFNFKDIVEIPFFQPISWSVVLCRPRKELHSHLKEHILNEIISFFS